MLAISSGYKNDLVCTQHAVSLTSFNFTARVGFITLLLSGYVCVCVCVCECVCVGERERMNVSAQIYLRVLMLVGVAARHTCAHTCISLYISACLLYIQHLQHVITIQWKNQENQHVEQLSHHTQAEPVVPAPENRGAPLCRDKPYF